MMSSALLAGLALVIAGYCWSSWGEAARLRRLVTPHQAIGVRRVPGGAGLGRRQRAMGASAVAITAAFLIPMPWGLGASAAVGVAAYVLLGRLESRSVRARREALVRQQPEVLDLIAAVQESGSPLRLAAGEVAALVPEPSASILKEVDARLRVGFSDAEAWQCLVQDPIWGATARDLARSARTGEAVVETLHMSAERARAVRRDHLNERARTVAVKSVGPMMACFLPAFILAGVVPIFAGILSRYTG